MRRATLLLIAVLLLVVLIGERADAAQTQYKPGFEFICKAKAHQAKWFTTHVVGKVEVSCNAYVARITMITCIRAFLTTIPWDVNPLRTKCVSDQATAQKSEASYASLKCLRESKKSDYMFYEVSSTGRVIYPTGNEDTYSVETKRHIVHGCL
jgi:hypothetical protein